MIAILSDIHSNIQALDAVLEDIPKEVSEIWVLGDTVGGMASNCEVLDRIMSLSTQVSKILGNWEENFILAREGKNPEWWSSTKLAPLAYTYDALQAHHWNYIEGLKSTLTIDSIPGSVFLSHAAPWNSQSGVDIEEIAIKATESRNEKWLFCGHIHVPKSFRLGKQRVVCVGSVGLALDGIGGMACYALLDGDKITFRHIDYDVDTAIRELENSELSKCAPGFVMANKMALATGKNYVSVLMDFSKAYDGTWEEAEQAWLESFK